MNKDDLARQLFKELTITQLPIGIYLISTDRIFLEANLQARKILELPAEGPTINSLDNFFENQNSRGKFIGIAEKAESKGESIETQPLNFKVNGRELILRLSIQPLRASDGETLGYWGYIIDVTEAEGYRRLFDEIPLGMYRTDEDDNLIDVNIAFAKILGYAKDKDVEFKNVKEIYVNPDDEVELLNIIKRDGKVIDYKRELKKPNGEIVIASVSSVVIRGANGEYLGRQGAILDVTAAERYKQSLEDIPVGYYQVKDHAGVDLIVDCNEQFVKMFKFKDKQAVLNFPIGELYDKPEDVNDFKLALEEKEKLGEALLGCTLDVKDLEGKQFTIEVNSRYMKQQGRKIGRIGTVRDITEEKRAHELVRTFQLDIGNVLHAFGATMTPFAFSLRSAIEYMAPDPFTGKSKPTYEQIKLALDEPSSQFQKSLYNLTQSLEPTWDARGIDGTTWGELKKLQQSYTETILNITETEFLHHTLRYAACQARIIFDQIPKVDVPREAIRQAARDASDLERISNLAFLHLIETDITALDHELRLVREFITTGDRPEGPRQKIRMWDLVRHAIDNLLPFAKNMDVQIWRRDRTNRACVEVNERAVVRALGNLLHNAIKYSWKTGGGYQVRIHSHLSADCVWIEFSNIGVPIMEDEVKEGLIFKLGYRGVYSSDRWRTGTGIGLTDAREVARRFGGDVLVVSDPVSKDARRDDYTKPFLTKVTFFLPICSLDILQGD